MLTMTDINTIRNLRNNHDKSINHIAQELEVNWRTAKKYADDDLIPLPKAHKKSGMMYVEKWGDIVALWLSEDTKLPKKKRRTAEAMTNALKADGFKGSYRTVCVFIQDWKATHYAEISEDNGFERLEHPPAEAQLDFGTMEVCHEGAFKDVKTLVLTFPFSNAGFAVVLPAENQECLLEGMKELFRQAGGIPRKIRIDNMSTAVTKVKSKTDPAVLTDGFLQFATHHGFETQVCNPRSGNEKGSVENKVGYVRYNFFSATPIMKDFSSFNKVLAQQLAQDRERIHYEKYAIINDLWLEEKADLITLPDKEYPVFKEIEIKANKYNEIKLDKERIHIPRIRNHSVIYGLLRFDSYQLISTDGEMIAEGPRPYMMKKRAIDWQAIILDWRRKPRAMHYSRYWKYLPERIKLFLSHSDWKEQNQRLNHLLELLVTHDMLGIDTNFYELIDTADQSDAYDIDWQHYDAFLSPSKEVVVD
ncbi:putative transposase [Staphylococcus aureus]|nr:putative transposase [Staphylococcus aureus]